MTPLEVLPQRYPFLLVDRFVAHDAGVSAVAEHLVSNNDPLLDGGEGLSPVLLVEAMAQCAGYAAVHPERRRGGMLVRIDRFRCRRSIVAGSRLRIEMRIVRAFGQVVKARGTIRDGRRWVAAAELTLQLTASEES